MTPTQYPNAVVCTQTLQPYTTVSVTITSKTRTTTLPKVTSTNTKIVSTTKTVTEVSPDVTSTQTITSTSTYDQSGTISATTVDTTITVTETAVVPGPTYYAACSPDNLATNANGGYTISDVGISGSNYYTDAGSAYECCATCQASNCKVALYFDAAYPSPVCFNSYQDTCTPESTTDYFYTYSDQSYEYAISNGPCGQFRNGGNYPSYS